MLAWHVCHFRDTDHPACLLLRDLYRPRRRRTARRRLRKRRGHRGMERDVALHLAEHLMNVTVQDGGRAEAAERHQRALGVFGGPAPLRVNRPEGHVGEDHDRGATRERRDVLLQPLELLVAQRAHPLTLVLEDVHEPDEVRSLVIEALPAALVDRPLSVAGQILLAPVEEHIVFAGHVEDAFRLHALQNFRDRIEGARLLPVRLIARMKHEGGGRPQPVHTVDDLLEGGRGVLFASPLKPTCVSLICTKVKLPAAASAAEASVISRDDITPPAAAQTTPVPAQAIHWRNPRRSNRSMPSSSLLVASTSRPACPSCRDESRKSTDKCRVS